MVFHWSEKSYYALKATDYDELIKEAEAYELEASRDRRLCPSAALAIFDVSHKAVESRVKASCKSVGKL